MNWAQAVNYNDTSLEKATHLVVGEGPAHDDDGWITGILAKATDQFTAYRIAREINKVTGANVMVMENLPDAIDRVHEMVCDILREADDAAY